MNEIEIGEKYYQNNRVVIITKIENGLVYFKDIVYMKLGDHSEYYTNITNFKGDKA